MLIEGQSHERIVKIILNGRRNSPVDLGSRPLGGGKGRCRADRLRRGLGELHRDCGRHETGKRRSWLQNKLFVTTQGADNTATVADGEVKMVSGTTVTTFATGLYEPKGIAFTGKYLIVADLARIWRIDASENKVAHRRQRRRDSQAVLQRRDPRAAR